VLETVVPTSGGRVLGVSEAGDPAGVPVLTLHGSPGAGLIYGMVDRDARQRGIRMLAYDRPGYGRSTPAISRRLRKRRSSNRSHSWSSRFLFT
jgi:pimeloyl-ACP methyl ester carboxylesterase